MDEFDVLVLLVGDLHLQHCLVVESVLTSLRRNDVDSIFYLGVLALLEHLQVAIFLSVFQNNRKIYDGSR